MTDWKIIQGDVLEILDEFDEESFDGCFCDPPYGLTDGFDVHEALKHWMNHEEYDNGSKGFMGKKWDQVPGPQVWKKVKRCVKPGANVLSFTGTRTSDLISIAMRLGGLKREDAIAYCYGSGFPKSHNISKQLDKEAGEEREAEKWEGWGTALKPSREDILLFRKPREDTYVGNALEHGVSGLNIDGARIHIKQNDRIKKGGSYIGNRKGSGGESKFGTGGGQVDYGDGEIPKGRWPTNTVLGHHPECNFVKEECHDDCAVRRMDESSGECPSNDCEEKSNFKEGKNIYSGKLDEHRGKGYGDEGGASRFFYTSKASRSEREAGLLEQKDDFDERVCTHPTLKPVDLNKWITTLIGMPPRRDDKRRLLIPFAGVGSEVIGAILSDQWDEVIGIELQEEYCDIARKRIEWWEKHGEEAVDRYKNLKKKRKKEKETGQGNLFDG